VVSSSRNDQPNSAAPPTLQPAPTPTRRASHKLHMNGPRAGTRDKEWPSKGTSSTSKEQARRNTT
jgi:hypothetical protein